MSSYGSAGPAVRMRFYENVAVVRIDDGKANALDVETMKTLMKILEMAEEQAKALVIVGRPGRFCAGFNLKSMQEGPEQLIELGTVGRDLFGRLVEFPRPVVIGCNGHAIAAGAILLLCADVRIGAAGAYRIGLNEVSIGIPVISYVAELARARLSPRHFTLACNTAHIYSPEEAVEAGFLDWVTREDVVAEACATAHNLAQRLDASAFQATRWTTRAYLSKVLRSPVSQWVPGLETDPNLL